MKMIVCKDCGTEYDPSLSSFPSCGCRRRVHNPFTVLMAFLTIAIAASVGLGFYVYQDNAKRVEAENAKLAREKKQELLHSKKMAKMKDRDNDELERVAKERKEALRKEEAASLKRERETEMAQEYECDTTPIEPVSPQQSRENEMLLRLLAIEERINDLQNKKLPAQTQTVLAYRRMNTSPYSSDYSSARQSLLNTCNQLKSLCQQAMAITRDCGRTDLYILYEEELNRVENMIRKI